MVRFLKSAGVLVLLLLGWQGLALALANPVIFPGPAATLQQMLLQALRPDFFLMLGASLGRALGALTLSLAAGFPLAVLAYFHKSVAAILNQLVLILRSVPNIAIIILVLFWLPRGSAVLLVSFLLGFPIVYSNTLEALNEVHAKWQPLLAIYPQPWYIRLTQVLVPHMRASLQASVISASSLCFKAVVMAEVLCQVSPGIGRGMQLARSDVNAAGVIGWTIWLLLLAFGTDFVLRRLLRLLFAAGGKR